jgi:hypothetical protein
MRCWFPDADGYAPRRETGPLAPVWVISDYADVVDESGRTLRDELC